MLRTAWELSAGMLSFVVAIALGWWFGRVLDSWFGTAPWLTRLFTVLRARGGRAERVPDAVRGRSATLGNRRLASGSWLNPIRSCGAWSATALIACAVMAAAAWALARGDRSAPLGVLGGGALVVDFVSRHQGRHRRADRGAAAAAGTGVRTAIGLVKFFTRYAILAVAAYVIMARLRLPPLAVFAGASSLVVAVAVEAVRGIQWKS